MNVSSYLIIFIWTVFLVSWFIFSKKGVGKITSQNIQTHSLLLKIHLRTIIILMLIIEFFSSKQFFWFDYENLKFSVLDMVGILIGAAGIIITICSRKYLTTNWSSFPRINENHILVMSGPYRFVRHPIYTGILIAFVGSYIAGSNLWAIGFLIVLAIVLKRIPSEENLMIQKFANQYIEYRKKTKSLIPNII